MYRVVIWEYGQKRLVGPVLWDKKDALYWAKRMARLGCKTEVVRDDGFQIPKSSYSLNRVDLT